MSLPVIRVVKPIAPTKRTVRPFLGVSNVAPALVSPNIPSLPGLSFSAPTVIDTAPRKTRGRPKKMVVAAPKPRGRPREMVVAAPKPRGRPRKIVVAAPKPRGRPRKIVVAAPKPRGRPRKIVVAAPKPRGRPRKNLLIIAPSGSNHRRVLPNPSVIELPIKRVAVRKPLTREQKDKRNERARLRRAALKEIL